MSKRLSIISPVYRAEKIVDELVKQIGLALDQKGLDYEIILVEDGSPDNSWSKIEENCAKNKKVKGVKLSKNFGQHYAITAGVEYASGEYIFIMDCDMQDNPNSLILIWEELEKGADIVLTKRKKRSHSLFKKLTGYLYNRLIRIISDKRFDIDGGSMVGFNRKVANAFLKLNDKDRLYVQMLKWLGFNQTYITVEHNERFEGKSSYTLYKMLSLALQGITSHSNKLLKISVYVGFIISFLSFFIGLLILILYFTNGFAPGWPSLFIAIAFATGVILMSNGIMGLYIGKTFDQVKNRPLYVVDKILNYEQK
jgi:polyisoprenyl-phosphate glycosyltransferase